MILVIGATSTMGREVVRILAERKIPTRAFSRQPEKLEVLKKLNVETAQGDLSSRKSINAAIEGISKIFLVTPSHPDQVQWEGNVVEIAQKCNIRHIVKLSTLGANPDSDMLICKWHGQSEEQIRASGIPFTFLRAHNFMQNILNFTPSIVENGVFRAPLGEAKLSLVDVRDVAEVAVEVMSEEGHASNIYRMTGPDAISFYQVADILSNLTGKQIQYHPISLEEERKYLIRFGMPTWYAEDLLNLYQQFREGRGARIWNDIEKVLGRPATDFRKFARDYAGVFRGEIEINRNEIL
jgi:uncharacterized protein YbjT (DUF2867 family)